jgi:hypothetical protein
MDYNISTEIDYAEIGEKIDYTISLILDGLVMKA